MSQASYPSSLPAEGYAAPVVRRPVELASAWLTLTKPRIASLVVFTAVVACVAAAGGAPPAGTLVLLTVGGMLAAGGAAAINHVVDRDIDAVMERTRRRPLVTGEIGRPGLVLLVGVAMIAIGTALAAQINLAAGAWTLAGALVYAGVYTLWLKRRTTLNIVIGGFAGSAAVLGGWAAIDPALGLAPALLAGVVFAWTPAHFWSLALARRADYDRAGVPMLPVLVTPVVAARWTVLHILATIGLSLWLGMAAPLGAVYWAVAVVAGLGFAAGGLALLRQPTAATGWRLFKWSGPYLGAIFLGVLADTLLGRLA
ncbi:MAG: protoheme IX farnesyltransferase [Chloroflexi bacterium]|nr:protoheme IX farnesyltransferase [Chloroflexota bacterium]